MAQGLDGEIVEWKRLAEDLYSDCRHQTDSGGEKVIGGIVLCFNVVKCGKFLYHTFKIKTKSMTGVLLVDVAGLASDCWSALQAGVDMLRIKLTPVQFIVLAMLGEKPDGKPVADIKADYLPFVEALLAEPPLERLANRGLTAAYLKEAKTQQAGLDVALEELAEKRLVEQRAGLYVLQDRNFEFGEL